jgi:hypothetical protein
VEHVRLPDPRLAVDSQPLGCTTRLAYAGAYQLTIWTLVPELDAELHSSYLGHPDGNTAVTHLRLQPAAAPVTTSELRPGHEMPVREARRLCLYDHLAVLRELVSDATGLPATVEVADQTSTSPSALLGRLRPRFNAVGLRLSRSGCRHACFDTKAVDSSVPPPTCANRPLRASGPPRWRRPHPREWSSALAARMCRRSPLGRMEGGSGARPARCRAPR